MKTLKTITALMILLLTFGAFAQNSDDKRIIADAQDAKQKLLDKDPGLKEYFESAAGYVIFPNVGEGAFFIGAAAGNGVVYEDGDFIGMADLRKIDVGFQFGGQAIIEVIFFKDNEALAEFKTDEFTVFGGLSATAMKSGISETLAYSHGVIAVVMPKAGLMTDVSVGGQRFKYTPMEEIK